MRFLFLLACAGFACMLAPSVASAQAPINPYRPVPMTWTPYCDTLVTNSGVRSCNANPDAPHTRAECGFNCPSDSRDAYAEVGRGTLSINCGDELGRGCIGAYFTRESDPLFAQCIIRVYDDQEAIPDAEQQFAIRVSDLRHQGRIDLVRRDDRSYARFDRRFGRQMRDVYRQRPENVPPGYYLPAYQSPCRH